MKRSKLLLLGALVLLILLRVGAFYFFKPKSQLPVTEVQQTSPETVPAESSVSSTEDKSILGVGNLPAAKIKQQSLTKSDWFGYESTEDLTQAVHEKSVKILKQGDNLKPQVLQAAMRSFACAHAQNIGKPRYLTIIDYSLPATSKRFWLIDLQNDKVLYHSLVAHGKNSGFVNTTQFSNVPQSKASSLGLFMTGSTYIGHNGVSLRLKGLEPGFNDKAESRDVVIHGAAYVNDSFVKQNHYLGRSWGCPALSKAISTPVINTIKNGYLVFTYYPQDKWLKNSKFMHCNASLPWQW